MGSIVEHYINGKKVSGSGDRHQDIFNPATGEATGQVALASSATVEEAIAAAEAAFPAWRNTPPAKRAQIMFRYKELLEKNGHQVPARKVLPDNLKKLQTALRGLLRNNQSTRIVNRARSLP